MCPVRDMRDEPRSTGGLRFVPELFLGTAPTGGCLAAPCDGLASAAGLRLGTCRPGLWSGYFGRVSGPVLGSQVCGASLLHGTHVTFAPRF